jgi:hypothetical protein
MLNPNPTFLFDAGLSIPDNLRDIRECMKCLNRFDEPSEGYAATPKAREALKTALAALRVAACQPLVTEASLVCPVCHIPNGHGYACDGECADEDARR